MCHRHVVIILSGLAWAGLIFLSSSTVITPGDFFDWFHSNVFRNDAAFARFQTFWGVSWLVIVKGWHVTEFAVLMVLATWGADVWTKQRAGRNVAVAGLFCALFAASDEWHQTFVPQRGGVISDVMIDCIGIALAGATLFWQRRFRRNAASQSDCATTRSG